MKLKMKIKDGGLIALSMLCALHIAGCNHNDESNQSVADDASNEKQLAPPPSLTQVDIASLPTLTEIIVEEFVEEAVEPQKQQDEVSK